MSQPFAAFIDKVRFLSAREKPPPAAFDRVLGIDAAGEPEVEPGEVEAAGTGAVGEGIHMA